ncbi:MAG: nuclear transport factor 2 family protein [Cyclobacteriaceae bacterium]|nr:nuclear transport factor 2 family protein [Cyclobacteriaceae bacterium]
MKGPLLIALLFLTPLCHAQGDASLKAMVDAERAFIDMARTQNRRDAFLYFLGDSAVTQGPDGPVKGKARLQQQPVTEDWLDWDIAYSDISASGDLGFNTGPWNYRPRKTDEKPVAFGEFNSVWKKQADGSWKNILDIGINHGPLQEKVTWTTSKKPLRQGAGRADDLLEIEVKFQAALAVNAAKAYREFLSDEARTMISGHLPFVGPEKQSDYLAVRPRDGMLKVMGSEISRSKDLGYVYGTSAVTTTEAGVEKSRTATFVRVWKREDSGWKIVLDVLSF